MGTVTQAEETIKAATGQDVSQFMKLARSVSIRLKWSIHLMGFVETEGNTIVVQLQDITAVIDQSNQIQMSMQLLLTYFE